MFIARAQQQQQQQHPSQAVTSQTNARMKSYRENHFEMPIIPFYIKNNSLNRAKCWKITVMYFFQIKTRQLSRIVHWRRDAKSGKKSHFHRVHHSPAEDEESEKKCQNT